jgi:hypothetical protein
MTMDWDPDYIADSFVEIMFNNWTHDELAYMHMEVMFKYKLFTEE